MTINHYLSAPHVNLIICVQDGIKLPAEIQQHNVTCLADFRDNVKLSTILRYLLTRLQIM